MDKPLEGTQPAAQRKKIRVMDDDIDPSPQLPEDGHEPAS